MLTNTKILFCILTELLEIITTCLIYVACTILWAIATDCGRSRQNFLPSASFLFNEDSKSVENTVILGDWGKVETNLIFFQTHKIDLWNKMRTAVKIIGIAVLIKELEKIKVWMGIRLLIEIK